MNAFTVILRVHYRQIAHYGMVGGPGFRDRAVSPTENQMYLNLIGTELWHWLYERALDPAIWVYWTRIIDKTYVTDQYDAHFEFDCDADACLFKLFWGT